MPSARPGAAESITRALTAGSVPPVLVRTVTGLEHLAAAELTEAGHRVIDLSRRQLIVEPTATIITAPPRLADDLFVVQATVADPGRTKPALAASVTAVRDLLDPSAVPDGRDRFAVSASFHGRRNYTRFDIEDLVGAVVRERTGADYHSRRHGAPPPAGSTEWRVALDGRTMWLGTRPFEVPLHRREWRRRTVTGSLHPPVAAAMARLARIESGHTVLDPFCGAGTLLLEASFVEPGAVYVGLDREAAAIAAARANASGQPAVRWRPTWGSATPPPGITSGTCGAC